MKKGNEKAIVAGSSVVASKKKTAVKNFGLTIPTGRIHKRLRNGNYAKQVCVGASVYLTAVLDYLAAEVAELSEKEAKRSKEKTIVSSHVDLAVKRDQELTHLCKRLKLLTDNADDGDIDSEEEEVSDKDNYSYLSSEEDEVDDDPIICDCQNCLEGSSEDSDESEDSEDSDTEDEDVVVGDMSIACNRVELYGHLFNKFGEIVSHDLPKYKVEPTCGALNGLLNTVATMIDITPEALSIELVSEWEGMALYYSSIGLKVEWLLNHVNRFRGWLSKRRSEVDENELCDKLAAKQNELEKKHEEVCVLRKEVDELHAEVEMVKHSKSQFGFSFFDE